MAGRMTGSAYAALEVVFRLFLFTRGGVGGGEEPNIGPDYGLADDGKRLRGTRSVDRCFQAVN